MDANGLKRRTLVAGGLGLWAARARAEGALEDTVVIRTTGGAFEAALKRNFFDPFTAATGTRVVPVATSYGDMVGQGRRHEPPPATWNGT